MARYRDRMVDNLSGGWQRTMLLARAAVVEPDLLLLDEPTNHMDIGRIGVLERFLAALPRDCAVVSASHDRAFLDDVTNRTLFLRPEESADFALPYSRARQALEERDAARHRQFENDMRKVRALRQQAAKLKNIGINSGSDLLVVKTKQLSERADELEERASPAHEERSAGRDPADQQRHPCQGAGHHRRCGDRHAGRAAPLPHRPALDRERRSGRPARSQRRR